MSAQPVAVDLEVRYAETDQMGVVHHAVYLEWLEVARTHLCARAGTRYADLEAQGHLLMVTAAELRYRRAARYGQTVRVSCRLEKLTSRGMRFSYRVSADGELLATGATEHLWVAAASGRPERIPAALRDAFQALADGPPLW